MPVTVSDTTTPLASPTPGLPDSGAASWLDAAIGRALVEVVTADGNLLSVKDAATGSYLHVNAAMADWLGRPALEIIGRTDADLVGGALWPMLRAADQAALAHGGALSVSDHQFEWRGERRDVRVRRQRVEIADGRVLLISVWSDRGPARRAEAQLHGALAHLEQEQRANHLLRRELKELTLRDASSGLYNRAHFDDQFRREVDLSTREHREFSLVSIAIDPTPGDGGDLPMSEDAQALVLDALGRQVRGNTRAMDASCRLDDTHFAVLLSGVGLSTAHARMEGLRRECAAQIVMHEGESIRFTVSMGVASFPHSAHTQDELLAACDAALAQARKRGGNRVGLASIRFETPTDFAR